jgi:peptidoglycan/xylan/chitin deacetylase (PgdA/CDA1 family)
MPIRPLFHLLSPANSKARLSVLIFHRILTQPDPLFPGEPDAACFDNILSWMKSWFNVLPLDEAVSRLKSGSLPSRAAAITFDDGYADNYTVALPILRKHGLNATVFVATGFLDGGIMWNDAIVESVRNVKGTTLNCENIGLGHHSIKTPLDRRATIDAIIGQIKYLDASNRQDIVDRFVSSTGVELPCNLMMNSDELRGLREAGMLVGAHTISHPILARISLDDAKQEIEGSKAFLEGILGEQVSLFAYPNGKPLADYQPEHVEIVKNAGFKLAMSTAWGAANIKQDVFQIPRFTPWDRSKLKFGIRMAQNLIKE